MDTTDFESKSDSSAEVTDSNVTEETGSSPPDPVFMMILFIIQIITQVLIIFGNTMVILAVIKFPSLRSNMFQFIFSLAVADLLVGLSLLINIIYAFPTDFRADIVACAVVHTLIVTSLISSLLNMMCIAIDRSLAINCPLQYHSYMSQKNIRLIFIVIWILSITAGAMILAGQEDWHIDDCTYTNFYPKKYRLFLIIFFFSMIVSLVFIYIQLFIIAHQQQRKIASQTTPKDTKVKSNMKAAKMLLTVLGAFLICWIPLMVNMTIVNVLSTEESRALLAHGELHLTFLVATMNSYLNPIIYAWKNMKMRRAFFKLLHIPFCWDDPLDDTSNNLSAAGSNNH